MASLDIRLRAPRCTHVGRLVCALVLGLAVGLGALDAGAQSPPAATATTATPATPATPPPAGGDAARQSFERGMEALQQNRFGDAALAFEESLRLRAVPIVSYNVGLAYRGLGRYVDAIQSFERYLAQPDPRADERRLAAIREELERMRQSLARVTLRIEPATATVAIDGRTRTVTSEAIQLDPGRHVVEITAPDYRPDRRELTLRAGDALTTEVRLTPLPRVARLRVEPSVANGVVSIDGRTAGSGAVEVEVTPGEHVVEIRAPGYREYRRSVRVDAGGLVRIDASLTAASPTGLILGASVGGGVVVVGAVLTTVLLLTGGRTAPPYAAPWGNICEGMAMCPVR